MNRIAHTCLAAALALCAALAGCAPRQTANQAAGDKGQAAPPAQVVNIGYVNIFADAPAVIGKEKGFFTKAGLQPSFYAFVNGPDLYKALADKRIDIAYAGIPQAVAWSARGMGMKVIAKVDTGRFALITKQGAPEQSVADFKGKAIAAVEKGSGNDIELRGLVLPSAGLTANDVNIVTMPQQNMEAALNSGRVNGAFLGDPFLTYALLRGSKLIHQVEDPGLVVIVRTDFAQEHRSLVQKFLQGHIQAENYLNQNSQAANAILAKAFNIPSVQASGTSYSPTAVVAQARQHTQFNYRFTKQDFTFYQTLADAAYKAGYIPQPFQVKTLFDLSFLKEAQH